LRDVVIVRCVTVQETAELAEIEMRCQQIAATKIEDCAVTRLALFVAIGFDHAHVLALHAFADGRSDDAQKHDPAAPHNGKTCPCETALSSPRFAIKIEEKRAIDLSLQISKNRYLPPTTSST
jgi:hypothetical protein